MTTVVQTSHPQPNAYPPPQQQQQGYLPTGYPPQQQQQGYPLPVVHLPATNVGSVTPGVSQRYNKKAGFVTGILQICAGSLLVLLGIIVLLLGTITRSGWNIWGGILFYVVTGILGVVSKKQQRCVIIAYLVMSIISAVCAGGQIIYDSAAASTNMYFCHYYVHYYEYNDYFIGTCEHRYVIVAMHSLSAIVGFAEMVVVIVASAYCCSGVCGGSTPATQTTLVTYAQPAHVGKVNAVAPGPYPAPGQYPYNPNQMMAQGQPLAYTQPQQPSVPPEKVAY